MNGQEKKQQKIRTGSIARRINAAQSWRRFGKSMVLTLLTAAVVFIGWCGLVEWAYGGNFNNVTDRRFGGSFNTDIRFGREEAVDFFGELRQYIRENDALDFSGLSPYSGIEYRFDVKLQERAQNSVYDVFVTVSVAHSASGVLTLCTLIIGTAFLFQLCVLLNGLFSGSKIIKKYLKPIDELALLAERLSSQTRSVTREEVKQSGEPDLDSLESAINAIEDSGTRLQVHDAELGSLEAALNNMLKRLDEGKRKQIRFVDDASHELRTPIAVIQGYIQLLDRWGKEDPKVREEAIEAIKTEAEHMKTLIDQLLFLARGEMDRHVLEKETLNICAVLEEIRDESIMLDETAEVHHEFCLSLPVKEGAEEDDEDRYGDLSVHADPAMIKQALRILRDNAVKYTPEDGRITFRAYRRTVAGEKNSVCIEISDTGIGINPKELPRIFDRFYRGEKVRADNSSGSGLGLSIAKWIVDEHGGIIEAISSEGFGTRMTVVLPECFT